MNSKNQEQNSGYETAPNYTCPRTGAPLHLNGGVLRQTGGASSYLLVNGIPQFLCYEAAESKEDVERLGRLNKLAREIGWESAIREVYGADDKFIQYVTNTKRASFIRLLPLNADTDVLEIGPGLGQFTAHLARQSKSVWGLEVVSGQAEFAAERCRQEGLSNVHLAVGGDDCRLPYCNDSFDLVIVNLVFEWCAMRCLEESLEDAQRRFLSEVFRVLRPGGVLYLATKNRYALAHLIGKPDAHCYGLRVGSALPRFMSAFLMRRMGHRRPFGLLHGYAALKALLRSAGLEVVKSFWAVPEMRHPDEYVSTDAAAIR